MEPKRPTTPSPADGGTPPAADGKPRPDMAALMMELARIRREVEGTEEARPARKAAAWMIAALLAGAVVLLLMQGPCRVPGAS